MRRDVSLCLCRAVLRFGAEEKFSRALFFLYEHGGKILPDGAVASPVSCSRLGKTAMISQRISRRLSLLMHVFTRQNLDRIVTVTYFARVTYGLYGIWIFGLYMLLAEAGIGQQHISKAEIRFVSKKKDGENLLATQNSRPQFVNL